MKTSTLKSKIFLIASIVLLLALSFGLFGCASDDSKYENFVDYVKEEGKIKSETTVNTDKTATTISAKNDGIIQVKLESVGTSSTSKSRTALTMTVSREEGIATIEETLEIALNGSTVGAVQKFKGEFDIASYTYDETIELEKTEDKASGFNYLSDRSLGGSSTRNDRTYVSTAVKALQKAVDESNTGCTMKIIGFEKLDSKS